MDLAVQVHPACPSPTCPRRMGSSAKTRSTCLQLQAGCAEPAGGLAWGEGGRLHSPGTQRLRTPPERGGTCRSGGRCVRDNGKFQRHPSPKLTHPRRHSRHLPLPPGAPRCLCLGAGEPQAGEGVSWWRLGLAVAPPREGGSPGAQRGFTHGARHSRPCPRPARRPLGRLAGIALCK